jgi:hypothetical protein
MGRARPLLLALALVLTFGAAASYAFVPLVAAGAGRLLMWGLYQAGSTTTRAAISSASVNGAFLTAIVWARTDFGAGSSTADPLKDVIWADPAQIRQTPAVGYTPGTSSNRDPTPTPTRSTTSTGSTPAMPSSYPNVVTDMGARSGTMKEYCSGTGCPGGGTGTLAFRELYIVDIALAGGPTASCSNAASFNPGSPWAAGGAAWCGTVNGRTWAAFDLTIPLATCPQGYVAGSGGCVLEPASGTTPVKRNVPCEYLNAGNGTWATDPNNPNCTIDVNGTVNGGVSLSADRKTLSRTHTIGSVVFTDSVTFNADGGVTVSNREPEGGIDVTTGPYSAANGGWPVTGVTTYPPGAGGGNGSGTGSSGSAGSSGAAGSSSGSASGVGGSCGGANQANCGVNVDDSNADAGLGAVNAAKAAASSASSIALGTIAGVNDGGTFGVDTSFIPSLLPSASPVACVDPVIGFSAPVSGGLLNGLSGTATMEVCSRISSWQEIVNWMAGVMAILGIARLFLGSQGDSAKG